MIVVCRGALQVSVTVDKMVGVHSFCDACVGVMVVVTLSILAVGVELIVSFSGQLCFLTSVTVGGCSITVENTVVVIVAVGGV